MIQDVQVEVKALVPTPSGVGVFLTNGAKTIAIFVDHSVAAAITMYHHGVNKPRPLTHDLIANILAAVSARVEKVVIHDLKDDTFYARLYLRQENEVNQVVAEIDARPSDAIAVALQQHRPIYVAQDVWDKTDDMAWALENSGDK